ncbi:SDR family oxidoreductase [Fulvivirga sediminis]|uniref:SDR family oxidoreductase n=1 Tax=Fulvivirga sediminis TaxID=2803949 RepID=A0A937F9W2_9BACT|nr:SDR family oxidoreductase [Fulvivirga sediminis]MBL3656970.1 SDR family oxidoreductase [Fulvivirga sediminis]
MDIDLRGKRALVCGSTQGIGKATAIELASLGAHITLVARDENKLQEVLDELPVVGDPQHHYICADFDDPESLKNGVNAYLVKENDIHILINNTGGPAGGAAIDAELDEFTQAFKRHLICNQILAQAVVPSMKSLGYGRIINVISTSVKVPIPGLGVSNTIRGAVANWSKTLSLELGSYGITVNNILPGFTETARLRSIISNNAKKNGISEAEVEDNMKQGVPAQRFGEASETAAAIAFLASPAAAYINGVNLPVDGGRLGCL